MRDDCDMPASCQDGELKGDGEKCVANGVLSEECGLLADG